MSLQGHDLLLGHGFDYFFQFSRYVVVNVLTSPKLFVLLSVRCRMQNKICDHFVPLKRV